MSLGMLSEWLPGWELNSRNMSERHLVVEASLLIGAER